MQLDGLKIRYATGGNSDGPTVLFLSPLPQSILCYDATWSALSTNTNLVALDLPGFGQSEGEHKLHDIRCAKRLPAKVYQRTWTV